MAPPLSARLRALWTWNRKVAELDEEIQFHLSEEADERAAAGVAEREAQLDAQKDFGSTAIVREATREAWGWAFAERLIQDVRYSLRIMRRHRAFSAVAILTLAVGIGATTAIYSIVDTILLQPLPFPDSNRLVRLVENVPPLGRATQFAHSRPSYRKPPEGFA